METKFYFADLISDNYLTWCGSRRIILDGGTGSGKSTFTINVLIPHYVLQEKSVLYLCNRINLYNQVEKKLKQYKKNVTILTYQALQKQIRRGFYKHFDLIICDECHYFYLDAKFNGYTDIAYNYVMNQTGVVIFMSATADSFFADLVESGVVSSEDVYRIPKIYDYVEKVYTYQKSDLTHIIDNILADNDFEKILVFVNSMNRLVEMHDYYGNDADYMCSRSQQCNFATRDCINNCQFQKRILFTTKVLDNGVDIIDDDVSHIISELFDIDSTLQAIGRKRPIDYFDTCNFYFRDYDGRAVNNFYVSNNKQLSPVRHYLADKEGYLKYLDTQNVDTRQIARKNKIFYIDFDTDSLMVNQCALKKYELDQKTIEKMKETDYLTVLFERLGDDLQGKLAELDITIKSKDVFLCLLEELENKKLFKDEQKELKNKFRDILGLHDRTMGINTLNGKLVDCQYDYEIYSEKERSRKSEYYNKRYWIIKKKKCVQKMQIS